jgi:DNA-binding transcriptional LysR family regulator
MDLVASGLGVGFLPKVTADQRPHSGVRQLAVTAPGFDWHVALIWRRGAYLSHAARAWLALSAEGTRRSRRPST